MSIWHMYARGQNRYRSSKGSKDEHRQIDYQYLVLAIRRSGPTGWEHQPSQGDEGVSMTDTAWTLFHGGQVLDPEAGEVRRADLLIRDDCIHTIDANLDTEALIPTGEDLTRIDATGKTLMPGMIDAHCHMSYGENRTQEEQDLYTSVESRTLIAAANLGKVLRSGVTSISQPGGSYNIGVALREGLKSGLIDGPRMTSAGRYLTTSNGLADWYPTTVGIPEGSIGVLTNTSAAMMTEIRKQVKNGVDYIKLADSPYGEFQAFTTDEMKICADLAHQLGRGITIHARGSAEVAAAVEAGMDWIMHGNFMTDECIGKLADSKIPLVPTLTLLANMGDWGHLAGVDQEIRGHVRYALDQTAETLHKAHDAGVKFVAGTDSGFAVAPYGEFHARELELHMIYCGLSTAEAIRSGTSDAAVVMGMPDKVGVMRTGAYADLLLVDGNPLKNIRLLQDKDKFQVFKGGRPVGEDPHGRRWHHERAQVMSTGELTYDMVTSELPATGSDHVLAEPPKLPTLLDPKESRDLLHDLSHAEADARPED
jgi:imidazolonepropionase-like amidohydrolase